MAKPIGAERRGGYGGFAPPKFFALAGPVAKGGNKLGGLSTSQCPKNKQHLDVPFVGVDFSCWVFPKIGVSPNHPFNRGFHYKPSILGVFPLFLETPMLGF